MVVTVLGFLRRMWGGPGGGAEAGPPERTSGGAEDAQAAGNVLRLGGARLTISNAQDIGARREQQDAFAVSDASDPDFVAHGGIVAVVADGMGGLADGGRASRAAVRRFLESYEAKEVGEPVEEALIRSTMEANETVVDLAAAEGMLGNMGTTLVAAALVDGKLSWVSVGDSRLYLLREGELHRVTVDHNVATELEKEVAVGRLSAAEAQGHSELAALTSFIGIERLELIDRNERPLRLRDGDRLLLCTDGLDGPLSDDEILSLASGDPNFAAESLVAGALSKKGAHQDNLTGVLLTYTTRSPAPSDHEPGSLACGPPRPSSGTTTSHQANDHA